MVARGTEQDVAHACGKEGHGVEAVDLWACVVCVGSVWTFSVWEGRAALCEPSRTAETVPKGKPGMVKNAGSPVSGCFRMITE
jgi:hypothetical protein